MEADSSHGAVNRSERFSLLAVVGGLGVSTLARYSALTPSPRRSSASALSGSANRGDFSRAMQLEVVDSPQKISNLHLTRCNLCNLVVCLYARYEIMKALV